MQTFTEQDLKEYDKLEQAIAKHITYNGMSTEQLAKTYQGLVWFSQLKEKIKANIFEIKQVIEPEQKKPKSKDKETK